MARYDDEDKAAMLPEPLIQRVLVLEKQLREYRDVFTELRDQVDELAKRIGRELGF